MIDFFAAFFCDKMCYMARRSHRRSDLRKKAGCEMQAEGELRLGKQGVYLVRGNQKLKSLQLVPWEQIVAVLDSSGLEPI